MKSKWLSQSMPRKIYSSSWKSGEYYTFQEFKAKANNFEMELLEKVQQKGWPFTWQKITELEGENGRKLNTGLVRFRVHTIGGLGFLSWHFFTKY